MKKTDNNVVDIRSHPRFQGKLSPDDPNYERDCYLRYLGEESSTPEPPLNNPEPTGKDPLTELQEWDEEPQDEEQLVSILGNSICRDCESHRDQRSWWKRLLFPNRATEKDLVCVAFPKVPVQNPITGEEEYLPEATQIYAPGLYNSCPYAQCSHVNPFGTCLKFQPKITY